MTPSPLPPSPAGQLQGLVTDLRGSPLEGVEVRVNGTLLARTSPEGAFVVPDLPPNGQASVSVSLEGFSSTARTVPLSVEAPSTLRFSLQPTLDAVLDFAELGGQVSLPDGLELDVPPQAVVDASGMPVSGPVQLEYTLLDDPDELPLAPGDFRALQLDGSQTLLESFGMAEVRLFQGDEPLQLGEPVTLRFPLFEARDLFAGESIGLWSFDVDSGLWQEEGSGQVLYQDGRALFEATVSHFSWWNCDMPLEDTHCLEGRAIAPDGNGVGGLTVEASGEDYSGGSATITASDGSFCANVKRGSVNSLHIYGGTPEKLWEATASGIVAGETATECALGGCTHVEPLVLQQTSDKDHDGVTVLEGDCADDDAAVYPGAAELCNGQDDDCDGTIDERFPQRTLYYRDADADGFGDAAISQQACAKPAGYVQDATDCDDTRSYIHPGGTETCNGRDDNCDETIDDGVTTTVYPDSDGDGHGQSSGSTLQSCGTPSGYSIRSDDCDDTQASISPSALELCDGLDNNCDAQVDEAVTLLLYPDHDQDGYGAVGSTPSSGCLLDDSVSLNALDCDDSSAQVSPVADELPNGLDDNCDGNVDEATALLYRDQDGDGYGANTPGALLPVNTPGYAVLSGDCEDTDAEVHPNAAETCDGVDNDCNLSVDDALVMPTWYHDADSDGYGDTALTLSACALPPGYSAQQGDCQDGNASMHPGAAELCNGLDDDCDGALDDGAPLERFYQDADGDGYGDPLQPVDGCSAPAGAVENDDDCDDSSASLHPAAPEACDLIDNDCDALIDEDFSTKYYPDQDDDGFGQGDTWGCEAVDGTATNALDCDDTDAAVYPGAPDSIGDGRDQSCDGQDGLAPSVGLATSSYTSIQAALDAASNGQTVWVGPGTYYEYGLTLRGKALTLSGTAGAEATVIDAQGRGTVMRFENAEGSASVVRDLTLKGGEALDGAGIYSYGASPTLVGLVLKENHAYDNGGGMYLDSSDPTLTQVTLTGNSATDYIYNELAYPGSGMIASASLIYNPSGWGTDNITPSGTYLTVEPMFLDYADSSTGAACTPGSSFTCLPADLHPALGSPLIDAGETSLVDVDGARSDIGTFGGALGGSWDVDADGSPDYFWPGEWDDAPQGFDPNDYDCDDRDPDVQVCGP